MPATARRRSAQLLQLGAHGAAELAGPLPLALEVAERMALRQRRHRGDAGQAGGSLQAAVGSAACGLNVRPERHVERGRFGDAETVGDLLQLAGELQQRPAVFEARSDVAHLSQPSLVAGGTVLAVDDLRGATGDARDLVADVARKLTPAHVHVGGNIGQAGDTRPATLTGGSCVSAPQNQWTEQIVAEKRERLEKRVHRRVRP